MELAQKLYVLEPRYVTRAWGGQLLRPQQPPIGEAWIVCSDGVVTNGPEAGCVVKALASRGGDFLGIEVASRFGTRFPLLIKLLDCADWLSIQVHPNDEQAERLEGEGQLGKTEAWHILQASEHARICAGATPNTAQEKFTSAIKANTIRELLTFIDVRPGESYLVPAGTVHALGPGLLLYEIQENSDITYRIFDWDRPAALGRELHLDKAAHVSDVRGVPIKRSLPAMIGTSTARAAECEYFTLERLQVAGAKWSGSTEGRSFHVLTAIAGQARVSCGDERVELGVYQTVVIAAMAGDYDVVATSPEAQLLRAWVPSEHR